MFDKIGVELSQVKKFTNILVINNKIVNIAFKSAFGQS